MKRRRILLLVALAVRQHGEAPAWSHLAQALGVERLKLVRLMDSLRRDGLVTFEDNRAGSARVTPRGLREAVGR